MYGIYSNRRISEEESEILQGNPDDYIWYVVILSQVFKERRFFQLREDIEVPKKEDDDGIVMIFHDRDIGYFKTLEGDVTEEECDYIFGICKFLKNQFKCPVKAYILCKPDFDFKTGNFEGEDDIMMFFSALENNDGEDIVDKLENKLKNNNKFSVGDSVFHMLLPFSGYKDKTVFEKKFNHYMDCIHKSKSY